MWNNLLAISKLFRKKWPRWTQKNEFYRTVIRPWCTGKPMARLIYWVQSSHPNWNQFYFSELLRQKCCISPLWILFWFFMMNLSWQNKNGVSLKLKLRHEFSHSSQHQAVCVINLLWRRMCTVPKHRCPIDTIDNCNPGTFWCSGYCELP